MNGHEIIKPIVEDLCNRTGTKKKYWAEQCGYDEKSFSRLLNGYKLITLDDIKKLCKGLQLEPNDLIHINTA